jgi:hypothetical protein
MPILAAQKRKLSVEKINAPLGEASLMVVDTMSIFLVSKFSMFSIPFK